MKKYYVTETLGATTARITGDTTDFSWAQYQMNYTYQQKLISYRHDIVAGGVRSSDRECSIDLKNGKRYSVAIKEVPTTRRYTVEITETLQKRKTVIAESRAEALEKVRAMYRNEDIVLDYNDYVTTDFKVL